MAAPESAPRRCPRFCSFSRAAALLLAVAAGTAGAFAAEPAAPAPAWKEWFAKNTVVTDKKTYVHLFWNANDVKDRFQGKDKDALLAEAARRLVALELPREAGADAMRVDIVFVAERDEYGMPKWDTMRRVAHLEFSKKKLEQTPASADEPRRGFERFEVFP